MPSKESSALNQEWLTLQNNYEQYEKSAQYVKLMAVVLCAAGLSLALYEILTIAMMLILWMQEAILRTSQSRLGTRILQVESLSRQGAQTEGTAFQLHSDWLSGRPGLPGLLREYAASAMKPTVAFPYVLLLLMNLVALLN
jgi:hypothetical protein